jgi:hypothetical protein
VGSKWEVGVVREEGGTYDRHDIFLDRLRHRNNMHEYREVDLSHVSIQSSSSLYVKVRGAAVRRSEASQC